MKRIAIVFSIAILSFMMVGPNLQAQSTTEQILDFHSDIQVQEDGVLTVTETITVHSTGDQIKRGIYRDFPTRYSNVYGITVVVGFEVLSIERDGHSEPYHIENIFNGKRIYVGQSDVFLTPGQYTYKITYQTTRQIGFFKDHDELYWNVTGNGWAFPIQHASATVILPPNILPNILQTDAFTGAFGSRGKDFVKDKDFMGNPTFETTRILRPQEGVTIFVSWPKGFLREPTRAENFINLLKDNRGVIFAVISLLALLVYYLVTWYRVGRDPKKGTIIPLFHPPEGFSPAGMRFLQKMGFDNKAFTAAVINMAVKGYLKIEERDPALLKFFGGKTYVLKKTGQNAGALTNEEQSAALHLFKGQDEIELKNTNHQEMSAAIRALSKTLAGNVEKIYFNTNLKYFAIGILLSINGCFQTGAVLTSSFTGPFLAFTALVLIIFLDALFYHLLKAPTLKGRRVMDQIEVFKMFLSVTEKDRLNLLNPPEQTPALFEKYLPYALALDVEQKWSEQFAEVLKRAAESGQEYHPTWYVGRSWDTRFGARDFSSHLGSAFSGAISASATAPGSSSGGGGGGSSGGGGGGGGGGGW